MKPHHVCAAQLVCVCVFRAKNNGDKQKKIFVAGHLAFVLYAYVCEKRKSKSEMLCNAFCNYSHSFHGNLPRSSYHGWRFFRMRSTGIAIIIVVSHRKSVIRADPFDIVLNDEHFNECFDTLLL